MTDLLATNGVLSVTARVEMAGVVSWYGAAGFADPRRTKSVTPKDRYRIASISKTFVAALIFRSEEHGQLSISDRLVRYYPDFPNASKISVRDLLGHTSGVYDFVLDATVIATGYRAWRPDELIERAASHGSQFEPGTKHVYTQTNYVLLGRILEKATGRRFRDLLVDEITVPFGLSDTTIEEDAIDPSLVRGTETLDGETFIDITSVIHPSVPWTAGSIVSTTTDLVRWSRALYEDKKVIRPENVERMCTPIKLIDGSTPVSEGEGPYTVMPALGCFVEETPRGPRVGHRGETGGFNGNLTYQPGVGHAVVLSNTRTAKARTMTEELWRVALDNKSLAR